MVRGLRFTNSWDKDDCRKYRHEPKGREIDTFIARIALILAMNNLRKVAQIINGMATSDGAGVKLTRFIGSPELQNLDPFLLLDEFKSDDAEDYIAGFPPHPHRGFETVTYLLHGKFRHEDSKGNSGLLTPGSIQWMTAGKGIIHSEMPEMEDGLLWGFQLWVNLPAVDKYIDPRYQDIAPEDVPIVGKDDCKVKILAGEYAGVNGAAQTRINALYLDITLRPNCVFEHQVPDSMGAFSYVIDGSANYGTSSNIGHGQMVVFGEGDIIRITARDEGARMLLVAGQRLNEPIVRAGPFVLNTRLELEQAFQDYSNGRLDA